MKKILSFGLCLALFLAQLPASAENGKPIKSSSALSGEKGTIEGTKGGAALSYLSEEECLGSMEAVAENSNYRLYFNKENLNVCIENLKDGKLHFTNPYDAANDRYYSGEIAERLNSQIVIDYVDSANVSKRLFSSSDCVELGQYKVITYENGIAAELSIGEEHNIPLYPKVISKDDFKEYIGKVTASQKRRLENYYILTDIKNIEDENQKKQLLDTYPLLEKQPLYIIGVELLQREELLLVDIFSELGYDQKAYEADLEKYGFKSEENNFPNFKLRLEYILTDSGLRVSIPYDSIKFDSNAFKLQSLDLLPYLLSDKPLDGKNGYLFVPDGSGAIININNRSDKQSEVMSGIVYGEDWSNVAEDYSESGARYSLPVYGISKNNGSGIFAVISSGDTLSRLTTMPGAPNSEYFCVYNSFIYTSNIKIKKDAKVSSMNSAKSLFLFDKNLTDTDFTVDYYFLSQEASGYSDMAAIYRSILKENGMKTQKGIGKTHLVLETVGTALYDDTFLGFPYRREARLTTYKQNLEMADYFLDNGISDIKLFLTGWEQNGLDRSLNSSIKLSSALGGKKEFKKLIKASAEKNIDLYFKEDITFIGNNTLLDGYNKRRDTARRLEGTYSGISELNLTTRRVDISSFTLSPSKYNGFLSKLFSSFEKNSVKAVNIGSLARYLNSDFSENSSVNREQAKNAVLKALKAQKKFSIAADGANAYALPYIKHIKNIPLENSGHTSESAAVPFLQMVIAGSIFYSSEPINMEDNPKNMLLACIASGTSPAFMAAYKNIELLKLTDYNNLYACDFENLKAKAKDYYSYAEKALKSAKGSALINHSIIDDDITLSYFENGTVIAVNRSSTDFIYNGINIPFMDYAVISEGGNK